MATVARLACRSRVFKAHNWPTVCYRSFSAPAGKSARRAVAVSKKPKAEADRNAAANDDQAKDTKGSSKPSNEVDLEDNIEAFKTMKRLRRNHATLDVWNAGSQVLDVEIPYDLRLMFKGLATGPTRQKLSDFWFAIKHNTSNWMKNTFSMYQIAQANGFPGITVKSGFKTWRRIGNVQSSSRNSLLAPFRRTALSTYQIVNSAVAKGNDKKIKEYTNGEFQAKTLQLMRRRNPRHFWTWDIVSNVSGSVLFPLKDRRAPTPVTVVSIRAADVYLEKQPPAIGHRLIIQALVKFDTTQKIDITDERGQPVPSELAEPRRVVQYLLLEKIGWYDTPWKIRDQLHRS